MAASLAGPAAEVLRFALLPADAAIGRVLARYGELALVAVVGPAPPQAWASWTDLDPVAVNGVARVLPPGVFAPGAGPRCILRFAGPIAPAWRETLAALGWVLRFDCPPFGVCADIGPDVDALRAALPTLRAIGPYEAEDCARSGSGRVDALPQTFDAVAFTEADRARLEQALADAGAPRGVLTMVSHQLQDGIDLVNDDRIEHVEGIDGPANEARLCVKGRFGFDYAHSPERLTRPLIRRADAVDFSEQDWDDVMNVNIKSAFFMSQAAGRHFIAQGSGKIINIASMLTFQGGIRVPSYTASKSGIAGITRLLANEWGAKGVNINAIAPGYMATDNTAQLRADEDRNKAILDRIPAGRWGVPADLGGTAVFLSSSASDYVNGAIIPVDGGWLAR